MSSEVLGHRTSGLHCIIFSIALQAIFGETEYKELNIKAVILFPPILQSVWIVVDMLFMLIVPKQQQHEC